MTAPFETSYSPAASGSGPPFRCTKVMTLVDAGDGLGPVPKLVDMEIIGFADAWGRILSPDNIADFLADPVSELLGEMRDLMRHMVHDSLVTGYINPGDGSLDVDIGRGRQLLPQSIDIASSGDNVLVKADGINKIKVYSYFFICTAAVNVRWKTGTAVGGQSSSTNNNLSGAVPYGAGSGAVVPGTPGSHWLQTLGPKDDLVLNLSTGTQVSGHLMYFREP